MWYILHLFVELDRFLSRYHLLPRPVQAHVKEMVTLRQPTKSLYQRDLAMFVGYVFIQVDSKHIKAVNDALRNEGIAEVLTPPTAKFIMPMRPDEVQWIFNMLHSSPEAAFAPGMKVRITRGAFEGMQGTVDSVAGQTLAVRVPLSRSVSIAYCTHDAVEEVK